MLSLRTVHKDLQPFWHEVETVFGQKGFDTEYGVEMETKWSLMSYEIAEFARNGNLFVQSVSRPAEFSEFLPRLWRVLSLFEPYAWVLVLFVLSRRVGL